jgi:hypothetical protein
MLMVRKLFPSILLSSIFFCPALPAQTPKVDSNPVEILLDAYINKGLDGRTWQKLEMPYKNVYMLGFIHGSGLTTSELMNKKVFIGIWFTKSITMAAIVNEVDSFYQTEANIRIPFAHAYFYVIRKAKGGSPRDLKDLERELIVLRKKYNTQESDTR